MCRYNTRDLHAIAAMICICVLGLLPARGTAQDEGPADRTETLTDLAEAVRTERGLPALAVAIADSKGIVESAVVGRLKKDGQEKAKLEHRFHIGSCTKAMTATMIATLVDDELLTWETKIVDVFPELNDRIRPEYRQVDLRQLLTHTAGIVPGTDGGSEEGRYVNSLTGTSTKQRLKMLGPILNREPVAAPGTAMKYSNLGYGIAAAMAEHVAGQTWETLMRERLFEPLDMASAGFGWPATEERPDEPLGHFDRPEGIVPVAIDHPYKLAPALGPGGNVHCTIDDLARFARMHLRGLRGEETILKADTLKKLHQPALDDYAMGWVSRDVGGEAAQWHNGSAGTFFAWMTVWPEHDLAIVVITNAGNGQPACQEITTRLFHRRAKTKQN